MAISAFHLDPAAGRDPRVSGTGGFALVAESDQPIYQSLDSEQGQEDLGFSTANRKALAGVETIALRVSGGDDASCLNLYQARQPRVLGVPDELVERGGFDWAGSSAQTPQEMANPWAPARDSFAPRLREDTTLVPCVMDQATALYSLHLSGVGDVYKMTDGRDRPFCI